MAKLDGTVSARARSPLGPKPPCVHGCSPARSARKGCMCEKCCGSRLYNQWIMRARKARRGYTSRKITPIMDRLWAKVNKIEGGCWLWTASTNGVGYGMIGITRSKSKLAHRIVYEALVGPIPKGKELDHLCRNPSCVNPAHLEAVTHAENIQRGYDAKRRAAS